MDAHIITNTAQHGRDWFDWVTAGAAVAGLGIVATYTALTYKQWKEAKKTNELSAASLEMSRQALEQSRLSFEGSQRARLVVTKFEFDEVKEGPFAARAYIANTGHVVATEVRMQTRLIYGKDANSALLEDVPPPIPRKAFYSSSKDMIGGSTTSMIEGKLEITTAIRQTIYAGPLMFLGRVQYVDGFDNDRTLRFCRFWLMLPQPTWSACFRHNWAD
jgi:hypothetical protein